MNHTGKIFLETASRIGARLCRDALWDGGRCNWLGDALEFVGNTQVVAHRTFGPDLYSGTSGVALFLARLFALTNERLYRITAEGALRQAWSKLNDAGLASRIGFYSGLTGVAYVSITLGEIFGNETCHAKGLELLQDLSQEDADHQGFDVILGSAGAIPALLEMHRRYGKDRLLDSAIRHGEHLLNAARKSDIGWSWSTLKTPTGQNPTGFSHGTAGIGWALLELSRATGQRKFAVAAEQAFRYEQHWFSREHQNWPDFRGRSNPPRGTKEAADYAVAWCHGAPGIGLSRLRAYELTGGGAFKSDAETAIRTTGNALDESIQASRTDFSLCHGLAGNAELFIYASQVLGNSEHKSTADRVGELGIEWFEKNDVPWSCGVIGGGEAPNLMLGIAGIGYFYLRLFDPREVPSILIILPERTATGGPFA